MQTADGGMRVPGAACAVFLEYSCQPLGVVSEVLKRHRTVLDEGDGFPLALHRHHDVEACRAHFPYGLLAGGIGHLYNAVRMAEIAHQLVEAVETAQV